MRKTRRGGDDVLEVILGVPSAEVRVIERVWRDGVPLLLPLPAGHITSDSHPGDTCILQNESRYTTGLKGQIILEAINGIRIAKPSSNGTKFSGLKFNKCLDSCELVLGQTHQQRGTRKMTSIHHPTVQDSKHTYNCRSCVPISSSYPETSDALTPCMAPPVDSAAAAVRHTQNTKTKQRIKPNQSHPHACP